MRCSPRNCAAISSLHILPTSWRGGDAYVCSAVCHCPFALSVRGALVLVTQASEYINMRAGDLVLS